MAVSLGLTESMKTAHGMAVPTTLEEHGIRPIMERVAHLQTNGKLERVFREFKRHRSDFSSTDEFMNWHNDRP